MPLFKKKITPPDKFLAIDINSEDIKCIAFFRDNKNIKIIGSAIQTLKRGSVRKGIIIDKQDVIMAIKEALFKTTSDLEEKIKTVVLGITGDLCFETITTAKVTRNPEDIITKTEISDIYQKLSQASFDQIQSLYERQTGDLDTNLEVITSSTIYKKLDGKITKHLEEEKSKQIEIAYYRAYTPTHHIKMLRSITKKLKLNILAITSKAFANSTAIAETSLENKDYTIIDVGSDFTSVAVVFGGGVISNQTLHIGNKHFVEEISQIMGLTYNEASKVLETHTYGKLSQSESAVVQNCLKNVLKMWLSGIEILFKEFPNIKTFATTIYLFGRGSNLPELREALNDNPWTKGIPFKAPPQIRNLKINDFNQIKDSTGTIMSNDWLGTINLSTIFGKLI